MENIIQRFGSSLPGVTGETQTSDDFSTRYLYKYRRFVGLKQEKRRLDLLNSQKSRRSQNIDELRGITDLIEETDDSKEYKPIHVAGFGRNHKKYSNLLMLSEWMVEKPADLDAKWYAVPCPKGKRVVVVHVKDHTRCYDKFGRYLFPFTSTLSDTCEAKFATILDCVYSKANETFYILDILMWNNYSVVGLQTEFRHYWLERKFSEFPVLTATPNKYNHQFKILPKTNCSSDDLNWVMGTFPFLVDSPPLDGWLFYHKDALYEAGTTPLVGWLKPFMVNEVLGSGIAVHEGYNVDKPNDYVDQAAFIKQFDDSSVVYVKSKYFKRKSNERKHKDKSRADKNVNKSKEGINAVKSKEDKNVHSSNGSICIEMEMGEESNTSDSSLLSNSDAMDSENLDTSTSFGR